MMLLCPKDAGTACHDIKVLFSALEKLICSVHPHVGTSVKDSVFDRGKK
jgi:hypothetical protein